MPLIRVILLRIRSLLRKRQVEAELDDELRFHVERQAELHLTAGLAPDEARTQALRDVGAIERWKEECRDHRRVRGVESLARDLRHTWRSIRARPGASVAIVLVLGLGLGLAGAMFALADPFVLRPLPYRNSGELIVIGLGRGLREAITKSTELPTIERWRERTDLFQGLTTFKPEDARLQLAGGATVLKLLNVSPDALDLLGMDDVGFRGWPATSSHETVVALTAEGRDALPGAEPGQVYYRQDGGVVRIGAILPPTFRFPLFPRVDGLSPRSPAPPILEPSWGPKGQLTGFSTYNVLARLQPGISAAAIGHALTPRSPSGEPVDMEVTGLEQLVTGRLRPLAWGALAAAGLILGLCAANAANLLLARAMSRMPEFTTRLALGASSRDLTRLVTVELAALVSLAVALGLALAHVALAATAFIIPDEYTTQGMPTVTPRIAGFTVLAGAVLATVSLIPWWTVWRLTARTAHALVPRTEGRSIRALRFLMTAGQSVVAMILVAGAALLGRSFTNLTSQDTGFAADALVVAVSYPSELTGVRLQEVIDGTIARLSRVPGVTHVGAAAGSMVDGITSGTVYSVRGKPALADIKDVSPGYFDSVGTRLVAGRTFADSDRKRSVVVINEAMASKFGATGDAIGQMLTGPGRAVTVIGVVSNSHDRALDRAPTPTAFRLLDDPEKVFFRLNYTVRGEAEPPTHLLGRVVTEVERDAVILDVSTLDDRLLESVDTRVFAMLVITLFAVASLSVCAVGLAAIVSFLVARRTREIAIRSAVGAEPGHVRWLVMRQAFTASAVGLVLGAIAGRWLSRSLESLLYGVEAGDWATLAAGAALLLGVIASATWLPATRALRISPTLALKVE